MCHKKMKEKTHLTDLEKGKALAWLEAKLKQKDIAQRLGVSLSTIERLAKKRKINPNLVPTRKVGSGRKKIASKSLIKFIEKKITENPKMTSKEMKAKYKKTLGKLSERTIRRILLNDLNLPSYIAIKKPLLTKAHKEKRVRFARKYLNWTIRKWRSSLFTDESTFLCLRSTGGIRVRRKQGVNKYDEKYIRKTLKHSPSLMIHASISANGPGRIFVLKVGQNMNGKQYLKVLKKTVLPDMKSHNCKTMFADRATSHTAKKSISYLKKEKLKTVFFPGSSPDINPIENVFSYVKNKLERRDTRNVKKLCRSIKSEWAKLDKKYLRKLCDSMPKRLKMVLEGKGSMTKY